MSSRAYEPEHFSDPKVVALQTALKDRDPFYSGICTIPDYQRFLYYTEGDVLRRVDFSSAGADDLEALYHACKPAEFGRDGENVLDESYRKAGKMDLDSFSTLFNPRSLGIHEQVSKALLTQSHAKMDWELYKLNVYGKGDFFKAHKDTPRGQAMFGSLVVVLPTEYQGGQFVLRQGEKEWTLDFTEKFATTAQASVCFVAFFGDTEHEVLPVTSGYRVTLTYNLYHKLTHPGTSSIPTPFYLNLRRALVDLVNDKSKLPNGGYLGFGLVHEYVHTGHNLLDQLLVQLKGSDRALVDVCNALGLRHSLRLLYRKVIDPRLNLITTHELNADHTVTDTELESFPEDCLHRALEESESTIEQVEGVVLVGGHKFEPRLLKDDYPYGLILRSFYRNPITQVLEITSMESSVNTKTSYMAHDIAPEWGYLNGSACMLITVEPAESRILIPL